MKLTTTHTEFYARYFNNDVTTAINQTIKNRSHLRIVQCGEAVVVLPDTNHKEDCTIAEMLKAMGVAKADNRSIQMSGNTKAKPRQQFLIIREGEAQKAVALTHEQERFLDFCCDNELFWDGIEFHSLGDEEILEI